MQPYLDYLLLLHNTNNKDTTYNKANCIKYYDTN